MSVLLRGEAGKHRQPSACAPSAIASSNAMPSSSSSASLVRRLYAAETLLKIKCDSSLPSARKGQGTVSQVQTTVPCASPKMQHNRRHGVYRVRAVRQAETGERARAHTGSASGETQPTRLCACALCLNELNGHARFLSGWCCSASLRYAFLMSVSSSWSSVRPRTVSASARVCFTMTRKRTQQHAKHTADNTGEG